MANLAATRRAGARGPTSFLARLARLGERGVSLVVGQSLRRAGRDAICLGGRDSRTRAGFVGLVSGAPHSFPTAVFAAGGTFR